MGGKKKSGSGFSSAAASWFACLGSKAAAVGSGSGGRAAGYDAAGGMVGAAKHFSSAHKINFCVCIMRKIGSVSLKVRKLPLKGGEISDRVPVGLDRMAHGAHLYGEIRKPASRSSGRIAVDD
uniref:Uncharacterized protein n=1 Tax=Oryza punctata TaxID=4537 RepID=A0A0E0JIZ5_ORYPU